MPERFNPNITNTPDDSFNPLSEKEPKLHTTAPVEHALKRREKQTGEKVGRHDKSAMLNVWMADLEKIHIDRDPQVAERIKNVYHKKYVIKSDEIPRSHFDLQRRIIRERGHGDQEFTDDMKRQEIDSIIKAQMERLDQWIDYLSSNDARYPMWFRYYVFTNITKISGYDKDQRDSGLKEVLGG